jgi:hypothetical protein
VTIEVVFMIPMLTLFFMLIFEVAFYFNARQVVKYATFVTARGAIVGEKDVERSAKIVCMPISPREQAVRQPPWMGRLASLEILQPIVDLAQNLGSRYGYADRHTEVKIAEYSFLHDDKEDQCRKGVRATVTYDYRITVPWIRALYSQRHGTEFIKITEETVMFNHDEDNPHF